MHGDETLASRALKMRKAELLRQIPIVALNAPAHFGNMNEMLHRCVFGQRRKPVLGRLGLPVGPLDQQPLFIARRSARQSSRCEARTRTTANRELSAPRVPSRHETV